MGYELDIPRALLHKYYVPVSRVHRGTNKHAADLSTLADGHANRYRWVDGSKWEGQLSSTSYVAGSNSFEPMSPLDSRAIYVGTRQWSSHAIHN